MAQTFPLHVVCAWIGNSQTVAAKHYLQVTDEPFEAASRPNAEAAQKAAQQGRAGKRRESQDESRLVQKTPGKPLHAIPGEIVQTSSVPPVGVEPTTY